MKRVNSEPCFIWLHILWPWSIHKSYGHGRMQTLGPYRLIIDNNLYDLSQLSQLPKTPFFHKVNVTTCPLPSWDPINPIVFRFLFGDQSLHGKVCLTVVYSACFIQIQQATSEGTNMLQEWWTDSHITHNDLVSLPQPTRIVPLRTLYDLLTKEKKAWTYFMDRLSEYICSGKWMRATLQLPWALKHSDVRKFFRGQVFVYDIWYLLCVANEVACI